MIHYHGTPLSGNNASQLALSGKHTMVSYATGQGYLPLFAEISQSFALDNGAFSIWKAGGTLDIEGYAKWVTSWRRHPAFDWYLIPDVIDGTANDNAALRAKWRGLCEPNMFLQGVPVWHLNEPLDVLRTFCNAWPRVAFGSAGDYAQIGTDRWWQRMAEAMDVCCDSFGRPLVKLHGLRMLDPTLFSLPFSSADSTNVARNCGLDNRWKGPYAPSSNATRALVLAERIERHASAATWAGREHPTVNGDLFG